MMWCRAVRSFTSQSIRDLRSRTQPVKVIEVGVAAGSGGARWPCLPPFSVCSEVRKTATQMTAAAGMAFIPCATPRPLCGFTSKAQTFSPLPAAVSPPITTSTASTGHISFIKDIASTQPPEHLHHLLNVLQARGDTIISPGAKEGLIPLAIPLSENMSGAITALLRWPTAPPGMEMPVVEVQKHGVWLLAKNVDQFIHKILVEEDFSNSTGNEGILFYASSDAGSKLYQKGDFVESQIPSLDSYILRKVGMFPDVLERKVMRHFEDGDNVSAFVTGEFYTKKDHFPGFARPYVFQAKIFLKVGRVSEAKDSARVALKSPWWTLGCPYHEVAEVAQWEDEQIEYIMEKVTEEGRRADLKKGKEPAQISLDEAAFLLDLASIDGTWDDCLERVACCYKEAGLDDIARFVLYKD